MELLRSPDPDSMAVENILQKMATSQVALERKVIQNILRMKQVLTPEQREKLLQMMEKRGGWDRIRPKLGHGGEKHRLGPGGRIRGK
jgi:Spy/CpxP family protein refolding chaperone